MTSELPDPPAKKPLRDRRLILGVAVAAAIGGGGFSWWQSQRQERERQRSEAVDLLFRQTLTDASGKVFAFEQLRGYQVVANFWATWCAPCVEEMPELSALATELRETGTRFVGIGVDNQDSIARFSQRLPVSYPLVVANATGAFLAGRFGNTAGALPYTVVLDASGKIKQQILGKVRIDELRKVLKSAEAR